MRTPATATFEIVGTGTGGQRIARAFTFTGGLINHGRADDGSFTRTSARNFLATYTDAFSDADDWHAVINDVFGTHEVPWRVRRSAAEFAALAES